MSDIRSLSLFVKVLFFPFWYKASPTKSLVKMALTSMASIQPVGKLDREKSESMVIVLDVSSEAEYDAAEGPGNGSEEGSISILFSKTVLDKNITGTLAKSLKLLRAKSLSLSELVW